MVQFLRETFGSYYSLALIPLINIFWVIIIGYLIGSRLAQDWPDRVLDQPTILGVEKLDESGVTVRSIVKTPPFKQADLMREWRRRVKDEFDRTGIEFAKKIPV